MDIKRILQARGTIETALRQSTNPCVLSSFGKDSLAILHLAAQYGVRRVLYLEDRDEAVDEAHIARTIARYGLDVTRMHSGRAVLYFLGGMPLLLGFPFVNRTTMLPIPTNVDPYTDEPMFTCVDDRLRAEHGVPLDFTTDCLIMGFKLADWDTNTCRVVIDQLTDAAKAEYRTAYAPVMPIAPGCTAAFPLLQWSHADVWDYLETHAIEASPLMYDGRTKRPHANPMCYRCHDPFGPSVVQCPKRGGDVMNLSHFTREADLSLERIVRLGIVRHDQLTGASHA